jgi:hypothetical protein
MGHTIQYTIQRTIGTGFRIHTPEGAVEVIVMEIEGTKRNRAGKLEIHGSQFLDGLVELTKGCPVRLAQDV